MPQGISTNRRITNQAVSCLRQRGIEFVCRYYSTTTHQPQKRLTQQEALDIIRNGMRLVTVYEDSPTNADYFSLRRGQLDGAAAHTDAQQIQQPANSAIYFAVDYDATTATTHGGITEYFRGVKDGLSAAAGVSPIYEVGVYGSGRVCRWIKEQQHLATYSWLAESTGWAESDTYSDPNIKQSIANHDLCGLQGGVDGEYENNIASASYGGFPVPTMPGEAVPPVAEAGWTAEGRPSPYVNTLVTLARQQYDTYHQVTENDAPLSQQIRKYWEDIDFTFPGVSTPWSAVFVSWCMRTAGANATEFRVSTAHSRFVNWAIQNQLSKQGLFRAHRLDEYRPTLGDIIQNNRGGQNLTYDFAAEHQAYESHSAIVVDVQTDTAEKFVRTVGGNEGNTVGLKRIALNPDGFVIQRNPNPFICIIQNLK